MTSDEFAQTVKMFSETAKTYTQTSIAALILPITFIRQVLGIGPTASIKANMDWPFVTSWVLFLVAIAAGLLYQYVAVKLVEARFEESTELHGGAGIFIKRPHIVYAVMLFAFYFGAVFFVIAAAMRFYNGETNGS